MRTIPPLSTACACAPSSLQDLAVCAVPLGIWRFARHHPPSFDGLRLRAIILSWGTACSPSFPTIFRRPAPCAPSSLQDLAVCAVPPRPSTACSLSSLPESGGLSFFRRLRFHAKRGTPFWELLFPAINPASPSARLRLRRAGRFPRLRRSSASAPWARRRADSQTN